MQRLTYMVSMSPFHYHGRDRVLVPAVPVRRSMCVCTSLTPRSMTVVFGLGTRQCVCMRIRLENGVLCNGQQPGSAVDIFRVNWEAMKKLSGRRTPHCGKHQFRAKITVST